MDRPRIYRSATMRRMLGDVSASTLRRLEERGAIPRRLRMPNSHSVFWDAAAVDAAIERLTKGGNGDDGKT